MLRLAFGEVATVLTSSQRCVPEKALASGFAFRFPTIDAALQDVLR
jgi:NAD dependent epimerase/dehydratase family enzyme